MKWAPHECSHPPLGPDHIRPNGCCCCDHCLGHADGVDAERAAIVADLKTLLSEGSNLRSFADSRGLPVSDVLITCLAGRWERGDHIKEDSNG